MAKLSGTDRERIARLNVRLSPEMFSRLQVVADEMGMSPSTVAAVAVGEYVNAKARLAVQLEKTVQASAAEVGKMFESLMANPAALSQIVAAVASAEGKQHQLPNL